MALPEMLNMRRADTVVVLDFETTGLSPNMGDRAIEIGAVLLEQGRISHRFQELMNPGFRVSGFIESYTGISNSMLQKSPPCHEVMARFADFIRGHNLVAHNASFDKRFLDSELERIGRGYDGDFACSMLTSRRIFQDAPNHRLESLVRFRNIVTDGVFHRALADAEMTAMLWLIMVDEIKDVYAFDPLPFSLMQKVSKTPKQKIVNMLSRQSSR